MLVDIKKNVYFEIFFKPSYQWPKDYDDISGRSIIQMYVYIKCIVLFEELVK